VKVPTPGPYSTNSLHFAQSTGSSILSINIFDEGNHRSHHHRMLDEAAEEHPQRPAACAARKGAVRSAWSAENVMKRSVYTGQRDALANERANGKARHCRRRNCRFETVRRFYGTSRMIHIGHSRRLLRRERR
jgi:hypothetical protein